MRLFSKLVAFCGITFVSGGAFASIQLVDGGGLAVFIDADVTYATSSSASGAASEASFTQAVPATTVAGLETNTYLNDMFDGYGAVFVRDGVSMDDPVDTYPSTSSPGFVSYNRNGASTLELDGRQVVLGTQTIGHLQVFRKVYVPRDDQFIRWVTFVKNTCGTTPGDCSTDPANAEYQVRVATVTYSNNLGSDSSTRIVTTSLGEPGEVSTVSSTDVQWVVTFQNYSGGLSTDPRIGHVLQGPSGRARLSYVAFTDGDDNPYWAYRFALQPGETLAVMTFATGQPSKWAAARQAERLTYLPATALAGLTADEQSEIANFDTRCAGMGDQCNAAVYDADTSSCELTPLTGVTCNDANPCTVVDRCNAGACVGAPRDCSSVGGPCAEGVCNEVSGACDAVPLPDDTTCDDGNDCTSDDACAAGACLGTSVADATVCDDHNPCTTGDACTAGSCAGIADSSVTTCDDGNPCTSDDACVSGTCAGTANTDPCDDGNACTHDDVCAAGVCAGAPFDDGSPCTTGQTCTEGVCAASVCYSLPNDSLLCADSDSCTDDACVAGACVSAAKDCSSLAGPCVAAVCDPQSGDCGTTPANEGAACDDGNAGTHGDVCTAGVCVGTPDAPVSDGGGCSCGASGDGRGLALALGLLGAFGLLRRLGSRSRRRGAIQGS